MKRALLSLAILLGFFICFSGVTYADETTYDCEQFSMTLPEGFFFFTPDNVLKDDVYPDEEVVEYERAAFENYPDWDLRGYHELFDFDIIVSFKLRGFGYDLREMGDSAIEESLLNPIVDGFSQRGETIYDSAILWENDEAYIYWHCTMDGYPDIYSYLTAFEVGDFTYDIEWRVFPHDGVTVTEEMQTLLKQAVLATVFYRDGSDAVQAESSEIRLEKGGYIATFELPAKWKSDPVAINAGYDQGWRYTRHGQMHFLVFDIYDTWEELTTQERRTYEVESRETFTLRKDDPFGAYIKEEISFGYFIEYREIGGRWYAMFENESDKSDFRFPFHSTILVTVNKGMSYYYTFINFYDDSPGWEDSDWDEIEAIMESVTYTNRE